jgi:hypothetical protein
MGTEKDEIQRKEDAWHRKAHAENLRCAVCNQIIPYAERDVYFRTKMCGYCEHQSKKRD